MFFDRGNHYEFLSLGQELAAPGQLQHPQTFPFNFKNVEKQYESYNGINVKLRYFVRVTVSRRMVDVIREKDLWVYSYRMPPETVRQGLTSVEDRADACLTEFINQNGRGN